MGRRDAARCGTRRMYDLGCRCFPCALAKSRHNRDLADGKPRRVPAGPVVDHLEALFDAGMSNCDVQRIAGLSKSTLWYLLAGKTGHVNSRTAAAILAIEPPKALQAHVRMLLRGGWTVGTLAAEAGLAPSTVRHVRDGRRPRGRTRDLLLCVEPLPTSARRLPVGPFERHLKVRWRARGIEGADGALTATERRYWCRARERGWVDEAWADRVAVRFGILLEEVYGPDLDAVGVAA